MDILIRNIDVAYVKEIDQKAEELSEHLGRSFSRNEYIRMLVQNDCELRLKKLKEDNFYRAVDNLNHTLTNQTEKLQEFIDSNSRLFHLMRSGIDILESEWEEE